VSAAIFGLIGVVVGALVTGGVDYVMQRRREKAELRQARRVVAGELSDLWYQLETITAGDRWPGEVPEEWFASRMWEAHRPVLASQLSDEDWNELARIYSIATKFRAMFGAGEALTDEDKLNLKNVLHSAGTAHYRLSGRQLGS